MEVKRCKRCDSRIPSGHEGDLCGLCKIGLVPSVEKRADEFVEVEPVESRKLSGIHCPHCQAEFSLADVSNRTCAICGAMFTEERMLLMSQSASYKPSFTETRTSESRIGKTWPDDAPLW